MPYEDILTYTFYGNPMQDYIIALAAFILSIAFLKIFKTIVLKRLKSLSKRTKAEIDDLLIGVVDSIGWPFFVLPAIFASFQFIQVPEIADSILFYTLLVGATYYAIKAVQSVVDFGTGRMIKCREENQEDVSGIIVLSRIAKIALWVIALLLILSNLGYNITPMIAGLGIGGIAIAFALQSVLGDVFASLSLYFDKPFKAGDFIIVGSDMGVVKHIGIKSTRLQTLQGQELIVPNKELTDTRVNNYKKMEKRRVVFNFGVVYQTPKEKLEKIPVMVSNIVNRNELAKTDRVHFTKFGESSLEFEAVYYVDTSDYNKYMDIQQEINLSIKDSFEKEGIEFAYPTRTVYMNKE